MNELLINAARVFELKVITGKGLHSGDEGPVLAEEVYKHIKSKYKKKILKIEPPPMASTINGIPLRGFFIVKLQRN